MNSKRILSLLAAVAVLPLASCSGLKSSSVCTTNCTTGNATLNITMYDTPPTGVDILSFTLPIVGISLTPSTGSPVAVTTAVSSVEATRLQTDSALIVDAFSVAAGSYTTLSVTLGPTSATSNVFINTSGSTITWSGGSCPNNAVCNLPAGAVFTVAIPLTLTLSANQTQWIGLNLNLANAITATGGLSVDFSKTNVLTAVTKPRIGLPTGASDTVEDFVGVVTAYSSGSSITVQSGTSGQKITAALNSSTEYDTQLSNGYNNCVASTAQGCIAVGSTVSLDAVLNANGTLTATEVDVLDAKAVDEVEGVIYPTSTLNVFGLVLADKVSTSGNAVLGATTTTYGTVILLNVSSVSNPVIDLKTLANSGFTPPPFTVAGLLAGQQIRAQVSNVLSTSSGITATASNVLLRFSRITGPVAVASGTAFTITPPSYISTLDSALPPPLTAYTFTTGTVFDGITGASGITASSTVSIRALFFDSTLPTFAVAKVRVP